jgi:aquaporin Z
MAGSRLRDSSRHVPARHSSTSLRDLRLNSAIEGILLAALMIVVSLVGIAVNAGLAFDRNWDPIVKRLTAGCLIALSTVLFVYSPLGRRSGAHINPAISLAFFYLKRMERSEFLGYVAAQFLGASLGISIAALLWGSTLRTPSIRYAATTPGQLGSLAALGAEAGISFLLMTIVLWSNNAARLAPLTGIFVGIFSALSITLVAPISGSSANPARTFGSDIFSMTWQSYWVYATGPTVGMVTAAAVFRALGAQARCAKVVHDDEPCAFARCEYRRRNENGQMGQRKPR